MKIQDSRTLVAIIYVTENHYVDPVKADRFCEIMNTLPEVTGAYITVEDNALVSNFNDFETVDCVDDLPQALYEEAIGLLQEMVE